jgi:16S rRNA (cytosine1402-N4)-methyltransferase
MKTGRSDDNALAAGGPARHIPVLLDEVLDALAIREGGLYMDGTFGAGGYTRAILATPNTRVLAFDRDPTAIASAAEIVAASAGRLDLVQDRFGDLAPVAEQLGLSDFDGVTLDIGVSSMQLDEAERGFSFRFDGPLDMRMEQAGRSAADIVNEASEEELADIIYYYGEERLARKIARAIVADRKAKPFLTTKSLADLLGRIIPHKPTDIHPATRTFQALRIAVNDELGELARALAGAEQVLREGGRLAVVSFHSLEDRIVKQFLSTRAGRGQARSRLLPGEPIPPASTFELIGKQPVIAAPEETARNPRARSAKLRVAQRTGAAARGLDDDLLDLVRLPERGERRR